MSLWSVLSLMSKLGKVPLAQSGAEQAEKRHNFIFRFFRRSSKHLQIHPNKRVFVSTIIIT